MSIAKSIEHLVDHGKEVLQKLQSSTSAGTSFFTDLEAALKAGSEAAAELAEGGLTHDIEAVKHGIVAIRELTHALEAAHDALREAL